MNKFVLLNTKKLYTFQSSLNEVDKDDKFSFIIKFILLLLLIIPFFTFSFSKPIKLYLNTYEKNELNYTMKNYTLYNLSKYPQISILIFNIEEEAHLFNTTNNLLNQSLRDIQILFLWKNKTNLQNFNIIKNLSLTDERISIFEYFTSIEDSIFSLMNKIKGKFTLFTNKLSYSYLGF